MKKSSAEISNHKIFSRSEDLPEGWVESPLKELIIHVLGGEWGIDDSEIIPFEMDRVNIIRGTDFKFINDKNKLKTPTRIIKKTSLGKRRLISGDIILEISGGAPDQPVGRTLLIDKKILEMAKNPLVCSNFCRQMRIHPDQDPKFVNLSLIYQYHNGNFDRFQTQSTNIRNLNFNDFSEEIIIPLPPLAEQQYIVARVEDLLEHVNAARERLSRVPLIMKKFREAVLAAACSGRLTEGWREENPDVESGSQLLERLSESRKKIKKIGKTFEDNTFFEKFPELPTTWTWSTIQQISERVTVGHVGPMKNEYRSDGIPFLRCQNVRENYFDAKGLVFISPQFHESLKKSALEPGDLVVVRSGNVGVCCIIPESLTEANCSDLVVVKKPFGFVPKFGAYYINSLAQNWIDLGTVGIALSHFNTKSVATLPIPIPPLAEQYEIVRRVGLLFERADAFDHEVAAAGRRCERLTQAVLGKAFAGKL